MGELESIFTQLNVIDQIKLNKYINREINKIVMGNERKIDERITEAQNALDKREKEIENYYKRENEHTWKRINIYQQIAMRELKISKERIKKIDERMWEINELRGKKIIIGEETKIDYKILEDADFQKVIELLVYKYCNSCSSRNSKCEVYPLLKKYGIPQVNEGFKCKYAYVRKLKMSCEKREK